MWEILDEQLEAEVPLPVPEAEWLRDLDPSSGGPPPLMLGLGETWSATPVALAAALARVPQSAHGYQLSRYGLPRLRQLLKQSMAQDYPLPRAAPAWELAVSCAGTRATMSDFDDYIQQRCGAPVSVVCAELGYDYWNVFGRGGGHCETFVLRHEHGLHPMLEDVEAAMRAAQRARPGRPLLLVLNPQHNPTGVNWSAEFVANAIDAAAARGAWLLIDDAYAAVHDPGILPTRAVGILQSRPAEIALRSRWLCVRSLGKQYGCNGWALGFALADPEVLSRVVAAGARRGYAVGAPFQHALASWLATGAGLEYTAGRQRSLKRKRAALVRWLRRDLGVSERAIIDGNCTPYVLFRPPLHRMDREGEDFVGACFRRTRVMLSSQVPWAEQAVPGYARIFLGQKSSVLREAIQRLRAAGYASGPAHAAPQRGFSLAR